MLSRIATIRYLAAFCLFLLLQCFSTFAADGGKPGIPGHPDYVTYYTGTKDGTSNSDYATSNAKVTITQGDAYQRIQSGYADLSADAFVSNNIATVLGGSLEWIKGAAAGSDSGTAIANNNRVNVLNNSTVGWVYGTEVSTFANQSAIANLNMVTITDSTVDGDVYGAWAGTSQGQAAVGDVALGHNSVTIINSTLKGSVFGGDAWGDSAVSDANNVILRNVIVVPSTTSIDGIFGGRANQWSFTAPSSASNNSVLLQKGNITASLGGIYGGSINDLGSFTQNLLSKANNNSVLIEDTEIANSEFISGGSIYIQGMAQANNNTVTLIRSSVIDSAYGISGGRILQSLDSSEANNNTILLDHSDVNTSVYGGRIEQCTDGSSYANNNYVSIFGGKVTGYIYGGSATGDDNAEAIHNTVRLSQNIEFGAASKLFGGYAAIANPGGTEDGFTGNTLQLHEYLGTSTLTDVANFQKYDFVLPAAMKTPLNAQTISLGNAGGTPSTVTRLDILGGGSLPAVGDKIILLQGGTVNGNIEKNTVLGKKGASLLYDFSIDQDPDNVHAKVTAVRAHPQAKSLLEGRVAGVTAVNQAADMLAGKGIASARDSAAKTGFGIYGATTGGTNRYKTGSHVDLDSISFILGASWRKNTGTGTALISPFFEFGWGKYKTHNDNLDGFAGVDAKGTTNYQGGGLLARYDHCTGLYGEASFRLGRLHQSYDSNDLTDAMGHGTHYKYNQLYTSLHAGLGYTLALAAGELDIYGKYFWTRVSKKDITVLDDPISFDATHSHRMRLGARYTHSVAGGAVKPYAGAGFEYEFAGKAKGKAYRIYDINSPKIKGGSGLLEAGIDYAPCGKKWTLNAGATGFVGKRRGIMGQLGISAEF